MSLQSLQKPKISVRGRIFDVWVTDSWAKGLGIALNVQTFFLLLPFPLPIHCCRHGRNIVRAESARQPTASLCGVCWKTSQAPKPSSFFFKKIQISRRLRFIIDWGNETRRWTSSGQEENVVWSEACVSGWPSFCMRACVSDRPWLVLIGHNPQMFQILCSPGWLEFYPQYCFSLYWLPKTANFSAQNTSKL